MQQTESTGISRRRLLAVAGVSAGATLFAQRPLFAEQGGNAPAVGNATASTKNTSFGSLKQIDAGLLNVGYAEAGPAKGTPVILLHAKAQSHLLFQKRLRLKQRPNSEN